MRNPSSPPKDGDLLEADILTYIADWVAQFGRSKAPKTPPGVSWSALVIRYASPKSGFPQTTDHPLANFKTRNRKQREEMLLAAVTRLVRTFKLTVVEVQVPSNPRAPIHKITKRTKTERYYRTLTLLEAMAAASSPETAQETPTPVSISCSEDERDRRSDV